MKKIRVLLADDHTLFRAGIRALLESDGDVDIVAESGDGREVLQLIERHRPDIALLDIGMPGLSGLEVTKRAARASPKTRVIILSMHGDPTYVNQALRAGVAGYLLKGAAVAELSVALQAVGRGETYLTPKISKLVIADLLRDRDDETGPLDLLTARQREIIQLIAEGHGTKEIARILDVSVKTVETHRARLMERLDIHDIPGLVRFAIRWGLVSSED